jgi:hypothetical protein
MSEQFPDDFIRKNVMDLLEVAAGTGVGVAFEPDGDGWRISYVLPIHWPAHTEYELGAGPLASAYDLATASAAAIRPLREMSANVDRYLERKERDEQRPS